MKINALLDKIKPISRGSEGKEKQQWELRHITHIHLLEEI